MHVLLNGLFVFSWCLALFLVYKDQITAWLNTWQTSRCDLQHVMTIMWINGHCYTAFHPTALLEYHISGWLGQGVLISSGADVFLHRHCCLKPKIGTCWTGHGLITPLGTSSCEYPYFYLLEVSKRKQMFLGDTQCPSPHNSHTKLLLSFWGPAFLHANLQKFITSHSPIN